MSNYQQADLHNDHQYGGQGTYNAGMKAWTESIKQASNQLQTRAKQRADRGETVATRVDSDGTKKFRVSRDELNALARQIYDTKTGFTRSTSPRRSAGSNSMRVHGLSTRDLHRPVTRSQAMDIFINGYKKEGTVGRVVNPNGTRRYPTKGSVAEHIRPELRGQIIPTRSEILKNPGQALRSRMSRVSGHSPVPFTTNGGRRTYDRVSSRELINACPDEAANASGYVTKAKALQYGCEDSWKLRRSDAHRNYQVPDVTYFEDKKKVAASPLYRRAGKQLPNTTVRPRPDHLINYPRRSKSQSDDDYDRRRRDYYGLRPNPIRQGQAIDDYRRRVIAERNSSRRRTPSASSSNSDPAILLETVPAPWQSSLRSMSGQRQQTPAQQQQTRRQQMLTQLQMPAQQQQQMQQMPRATSTIRSRR